MEILISILSSGVVVGLISHFFTRQKGKQEVRKLKAEAQGDELDNYRKMREIIQTELQPYIDRIQHLEEKIAELKSVSCINIDCKNRNIQHKRG